MRQGQEFGFRARSGDRLLLAGLLIDCSAKEFEHVAFGAPPRSRIVGIGCVACGDKSFVLAVLTVLAVFERV